MINKTFIGLVTAAACAAGASAKQPATSLSDLTARFTSDQQRNTQNFFRVNTANDTTDAGTGDGTCADATGACSLRAAIQEANASSARSVIKLPRDVYRLTLAGTGEDAAATGDLDIASDVFIFGDGAVIDADGQDRAFDVVTGGDLILTGARVMNGVAPDTQSGGAIRSVGEAVLYNVELLNNTVSGAGASGGAAFNNGGTLRIITSTLRGNSATRAGGAIEALGGVTQLEDTNLLDNTTGPMPGNGGGLHLTGAGHVSAVGGVVRGNFAAAEGGGLWNSAVGDMQVSHVVLSANEAAGDAADNGGGALFNDGGTLSVSNVKIDFNVASGAAGSGGGIFNNDGHLSVLDSALVNNSANRAGGGIESNLGDNTLRDTNLVDNVTGSAPGNGGGMHITGAGNASISGGIVKGNFAAAEGGGLWNGSGEMFINRVRISLNVASGAGADQGGGGLFNNRGHMSVFNSTIDDNAADTGSGSGGGILNDQGTLVVVSSNIIGNESQRAGGGIEANVGDSNLRNILMYDNRTGASPGNGGGFHLTGPGQVVVRNSGVLTNDASNEGGGLWNSSTGTMEVFGTRIDGNTAPDGPEVFNDGGTFTIDGVPVPAG